MKREPVENSRETELGQLLELIHGSTAAQVFHYMSRTMHAVDLSFSQVSALFRLNRFGPQSIAALAEGVHLSHAAASRMVEKLVREGLAHRNQDPDNRRRKLVRLSIKGNGYLDDLRSITAKAYTELFAAAPGRLRKDLWSVLNEIKHYLPRDSCSSPPPTPTAEP